MSNLSTAEASMLDPTCESPVEAATGDGLIVKPGACVGRLVALSADGRPVVTHPLSEGRHPARTCVPLEGHDVDRDVVLLFEAGNPAKPIVMGVLRHPGERRTIVLTADESITLQCGQSSVTLSNGKVVVRGLHVVTHASGVNRIRGGSVQIN